MPERDSNIDWLRKRVYWPAVSNPMWALTAEGTATFSVAHNLGATPDAVLLGLSEDDGTANDIAPGTHTEALAVATLATASKAFALCGITGKEVSTFGFPGVTLVEDDKVAFCRRVPLDVDPKYAMGVRVNFTTGSSTALDDFTFLALLDFKAVNAALIAPVTALDTAIVTQTLGTATAYLNKWSPRGIKNANFLTRAQVEAGAMMMLSIEADVADTTAILLGVEIDYVPQQTKGSGSHIDRDLTA